MSDPGTSQPFSFGSFWGGLVIFGIIDLPLAMWGFGNPNSSVPALAIFGATVVLAGLLFWRARSVALGVLAGYVLMTIVSGGACTFTFTDPLNEGDGAVWGLLLYPAVLLVTGAGALIAYLVRRRGTGGS